MPADANLRVCRKTTSSCRTEETKLSYCGEMRCGKHEPTDGMSTKRRLYIAQRLLALKSPRPEGYGAGSRLIDEFKLKTLGIFRVSHILLAIKSGVGFD